MTKEQFLKKCRVRGDTYVLEIMNSISISRYIAEEVNWRAFKPYIVSELRQMRTRMTDEITAMIFALEAKEAKNESADSKTSGD